MKHLPLVGLIIVLILYFNQCSVISSQKEYMNIQSDSAKVYRDQLADKDVFYNEVVELHKQSIKQLQEDNKQLGKRLK